MSLLKNNNASDHYVAVSGTKSNMAETMLQKRTKIKLKLNKRKQKACSLLQEYYRKPHN